MANIKTRIADTLVALAVKLYKRPLYKPPTRSEVLISDLTPNFSSLNSSRQSVSAALADFKSHRTAEELIALYEKVCSNYWKPSRLRRDQPDRIVMKLMPVVEETVPPVTGDANAFKGRK